MLGDPLLRQCLDSAAVVADEGGHHAVRTALPPLASATNATVTAVNVHALPASRYPAMAHARTAVMSTRTPRGLRRSASAPNCSPPKARTP
jgi:hypothetical protein